MVGNVINHDSKNPDHQCVKAGLSDNTTNIEIVNIVRMKYFTVITNMDVTE